MSNLRLTIIMFMLAVVIAMVMLAGGAHSSSPVTSGPSSGKATVDPALFAPAGLKRAPWEGQVAQRPKPPAKPAADPAGIAVLELFTSEGCSSCPSAEKLLNELARTHAGDASILLLAFHVDYWDKLGWPDRFAHADFTARQKRYADAFRSTRTYTPQLVVNGAREFVGSDRDQAAAAIAEARAAAPRLRVSIDPVELKPGATATIGATLSPAAADGTLPDSVEVLVAVLEDGLSTSVSRGENEGRTLQHDRVVRGMTMGTRDQAGRVRAEVPIPADLKPASARVIVLVQDPKSMRIIGAGQTAAAAK